ncbi:hypothetical protein CR513_32567, partial [Mucuna pruriens]
MTLVLGAITMEEPRDMPPKDARVQDLLDDEHLRFEDKGPNMHNNTLLAHSITKVNVISHMDERVVIPNRRRDGEPGQTVDPVNQVEEGSYLYQSNDVIVVAYIEGNDNPRPKPLIIQYNSTPRPVPFIIQVATKPVYNNNVVPWSGRIFSLDALRNKESAPAKKEKTIELPKRMVMEEETREFLKVIRHREYKMLDQL